MRDIGSIICIERGESDWKINDSRLLTEQAKEAVERRLPQQLGELTVDTSKRNDLPYLIQQNFPDHLKGSNNGIYTTPVYAFGRSIGSEGEKLHVALQRSTNNTSPLKEIVGIPIDSIENYRTLHEFYQI